jgi:large subunit ribosomal protein L35
MPKMKTHRGAAKRFKISKSGKVVRRRAFKSHLLSSKNRKRKRHLRHVTLVSSQDSAMIRRLLPYL